jgi:hypothetical protein
MEQNYIEKETNFFEKDLSDLNISIRLLQMFSDLGVTTIGELTQKYTSEELLDKRRLNQRMIDEINTLFRENNQPPYIV